MSYCRGCAGDGIGGCRYKCIWDDNNGKPCDTHSKTELAKAEDLHQKRMKTLSALLKI